MTPATTIERRISKGSSSSSSSSERFGGRQQSLLQYGSDGLLVLLERLRLKILPWQAPDNFPNDTSNYN
jgi:hypothetical protein